MSKNTQIDRSKFALRQVAENEELHQHLRIATIRLRQAWQRASGRPVTAAVEDKKLYDRIREAAIALARAVKLMGPEPEPPKRRGRKLLVLATAAGATVVILKKRSQARTPESAPFPAPAGTPAPSPSPAQTTA
jgi:hypothetical protein